MILCCHGLGIKMNKFESEERISQKLNRHLIWRIDGKNLVLL